ncbi:MAG: protein kinase [Myxococcales bacterium]|nr:protein kinase [Myxococcales bacterium]
MPSRTILGPGTLVADRFEVGELVDSGGMGSVYRVLDRHDGGRPAALKVIRGELTAGATSDTSLDTQQVLDSFQREAELLANLRHPSIVKYVCHGRTRRGEPYLAMEWVEGEDLQTRLERGPLSVAETLQLGLRLAEGLAAAHRVGVVHRDIKPSNILLPAGDVGQAKIADFGIAQFTQYVVIPGGTPGYMAPELHLAPPRVDARADVYSLGLMLSRCLAPSSPNGQLADEVDTATIIEGKAPPVDGTTLGLSVPAELDELLRRMLSTDRNLRPAHGGVVASALHAVALRLGSVGSSVLSAQEQQLVAAIRVRFDEGTNPDQEAISDVLARFGAVRRTTDERGLVVLLESRVSEGDHPLRAALCALEVRVLLDCVSKGRSVTIAGDRAQKMIFDNGFVDWPQLLEDAGLPHVEIQPLKITYRSTREVMEFSRYVLGPLHNPEDDLIARDGAPVGYFEFGDQGEAVAFLGEALRGLMQREPTASVALIARYPQQADLYYEALRVAEVPKLRRVRREDFTFSPGIDVTDVRQVKGLEFDYVVLLDPTRQNFPVTTPSRHLMHIAATRAAFQLWLICAGERSPLLPPELVNQLG